MNSPEDDPNGVKRGTRDEADAPPEDRGWTEELGLTNTTPLAYAATPIDGVVPIITAAPMNLMLIRGGK